MKLDFVALDVETANSNYSSICQIGLAKYVDGELVEGCGSLINPKVAFDCQNIKIHGITGAKVATSPTFPEIVDKLRSFTNGAICVSHGPFDQQSIDQALEKYGLPKLDVTWLNSIKVVRRAWPKLAQKSCKLPDVCQELGYPFKHHHALEDAKACGYILLSAIKETGLDVEDWLERVEKPVNPSKRKTSRSKGSSPVKREGNPKGRLYGEVLVFTGPLQISREEAADLAADIGCKVAGGVTKKTTMLVVGEGGSKTAKYKKAEQRISEGQKIRILTEKDFLELIKGNLTLTSKAT